jgi:hypothetical protein
LFQIHEYAGLALTLGRLEAEVSPKYKVHCVVAKAVLGHRDVGTQTPKLITELASGVEQAKGMDITQGLLNTQMDVHNLAHRAAFSHAWWATFALCGKLRTRELA